MPRRRRIRRDASVAPLSELVKFNSDQVEDLTKDALKDFGAVFETCKSVVALSCTYDGYLLLASSGTVVDHVGSETWIITSASLVRIPGTEHQAYNSDDIKIKVVLHNKQNVEGSLAMCDLHYNLAIVTIKSPIDLPAVKLSDLPECYYMQPKAVVAVGRDTGSVVLMRCGKLIRENSELDCSELFVTTCDINENFIGGPIMDSENRILGITFFYKETTPFLPVEIAARCLKSFKNKILLPWLCIRGKAVHMLDLPVLENLICKHNRVPSGILVNKGASNTGGAKVVYYLQPWNVDPVALQRRSELETRQMKQKQRRKQLAEESALRTRNKIEIMIDCIPKRRRSPSPNDDMENDHKTEVINAGESALLNVWHPYHHSPDIGYSCTLKEASWAVERSVLQVAPCVVALQSLTGETQLFSCCGTIVEVSEGIGLIVTVANLVKSPDADELAENLKINVFLQNREVLDGHLSTYDFYHNICVIKFEIARRLYLLEEFFSSNINIWAINFDECCSKDVVALGRDRRTHILSVSTGKIIPKDSELDCEELMVSSCKISKEAVGGLLMDFDGNIIGMNYYHSKETPFIPSFIVSKCLMQLKKSCKVVRPWHGLQVRNLYAEGHDTYENTQTILSGINGVIIEKMEDQFSEKAVDLYEGDIIDRVNGVKFSNAAELGSILLDIGAEHDDSKGMEMYLKFGL